MSADIESHRTCIRGCTVKGVHYSTCNDYGREDPGACRGCAPRAARDGALICNADFGRIRSGLDAVADLIGLIRTKAYPIRAAVFDREMVGGTMLDMTPAPVSVDLVDAGDQIMRGLRAWAHYAAHGATAERGWAGLDPGADADAAYDDAHDAAAMILGALEHLANDAHQVVELAAFVLVQHPHGGDHDDEPWSIADALAKWPLEERAWWAAQPCPICGLRTIRVSPARSRAGRTTFACQGCAWMVDDADEARDWTLEFSRATGVAA